jgi:hypothetical protein
MIERLNSLAQTSPVFIPFVAVSLQLLCVFNQSAQLFFFQIFE